MSVQMLPLSGSIGTNVAALPVVAVFVACPAWLVLS